MEPNLIRTVLEVGGAMVLLPLTLMAMRWLRVKFKLDKVISEEAMEAAATRIVDGAIGATEQFARNHVRALGESPHGSKKKEHAMRLAELGMKESRIDKDEDQISRLIEARLGHPEAPGGVVQPMASYSLAPPPMPEAGSLVPTMDEGEVVPGPSVEMDL